MKAIILAAGQGTRLKKYTENLPKGMLLFLGKTVIERQIEMYHECGINDVIVVRGYAAEKITYQSARYYMNEDYAQTNMVASLMAARKEFADDVIVSYSDILFEKAMLRTMIDSKYEFSVAVDKKWEKYWNMRYGRINFDTESLVMDDEKNITSLGLENPPLEEISARYIGLLKFKKEALDKICSIWDRDCASYGDRPWQQSGKTIRKAYMTDLLNALIEDGNQIKAVEFANGWVEFDTNEDYEAVCGWAEDGRLNEIINMGD